MSPGRRPDIPDGEQLHALMQAGATYHDLADTYDCTPSTIERRVTDYTGDYGEGRGPRPVAWLWELPDWLDRALCAQTDPESFFPHKGGSTRQAKSVCLRCTVSAECLDWALEHDERHGIWGGLSGPERHKIQRDLDTLQEPA